MASYEFGFLLEQALGHVTHAKNLLTNVALDPEVHAHWGLIDFEATGIAGKIPVTTTGRFGQGCAPTVRLLA